MLVTDSTVSILNSTLTYLGKAAGVCTANKSTIEILRARAEIAGNQLNRICIYIEGIKTDTRITNIVMRSNNGSYAVSPENQPGMQWCSLGGSGLAANCDVRASCKNYGKNESGIGVKCICDPARGLKPAGNDVGGSKCRQEPASSAFFELRSTNAIVRKPKNFTTQFFLEVEGESTTAFTATCDENYIEVHKPEGNIKLSSSKSSKKHPFKTTIIGRKTNWADSLQNKIATVTLNVAVPPPQAVDMTQTVKFIIQLQPYASSKFTQIRTVDTLTHLARRAEMILEPRDTDDLLITQTQFEFRLHLQYENQSLGSSQWLTAFEMKTLPIPSQSIPWQLNRPGRYTIAAVLRDGWSDKSDATDEAEMCTIKHTSFEVSCADKYHQQGTHCKPTQSNVRSIAFDVTCCR